jgi:hypothetical protein
MVVVVVDDKKDYDGEEKIFFVIVDGRIDSFSYNSGEEGSVFECVQRTSREATTAVRTSC